MTVILGFTSDVLLPEGDYEVTFEQLRASPLVLGPAEPCQCPDWLARAARSELRSARCSIVGRGCQRDLC